jgi:uncharacterized protein YndB with AHSA1/START domain
MSRKTRSIETEIRIEAPVDAVWSALTRAEELVRWFPLDAGENPDGSLWMSWGEGFRFQGCVAESDPPSRLRFVFSQPPPGRDPASLEPEDLAQIATEYVLESEGSTTLLRLVHSGFGTDAEWDDQFEGTRTGWEVELRGLRHYLENHRGLDRVVAWAKAPFTANRAEAWRRILSSRGLLADGALEGAREGSRYRIRARNGDVFEGIVMLWDPPRNFVATVESWNRALLRLRLEDLYGRREAHLWLSTYGLPRERAVEFQKRWQAELESLLSA